MKKRFFSRIDGLHVGNVYYRKRGPLSERERAYCQKFLESFARGGNGKAKASTPGTYRDESLGERDSITQAPLAHSPQSQREPRNSMFEQKQKGEMKMAEKQPVNKVIVSGVINKINIKDDAVWILVNAGPGDTKKLSLTAHEKESRARKDLLSDLKKFEEGDWIDVLAFVRPWSKQVDGNWLNSVDIRIIDVKKDCIPNRQPKAAAERIELSKPCGLSRFERGGLANVPNVAENLDSEYEIRTHETVFLSAGTPDRCHRPD